jgi:dihydroneopterin aldolase
MDAVTLSGVRVHARCGADPGEQDAPQPLDVELTAWLDLRAAVRSDALDDTLDYAALHRAIVRIASERAFTLLEAFAGTILDLVMADSRVTRARVSVAKPGKLGGATPAVVLERDRER